LKEAINKIKEMSEESYRLGFNEGNDSSTRWNKENSTSPQFSGENELRTGILLSAQRALLGYSPCSLLKVGLDWEKAHIHAVTKSWIKVYFVFTEGASDDDLSIVGDVTGQISSDFEEFIVSEENFCDLSRKQHFRALVFSRE